MSAIGLAAIGTVADVVPLLDENRIIVKHGLRALKANATIGIQSLLKVAKLDKKSSLTSEDIGFGIGPRLNAAGRLGQAQLGVELLTTDSESRAKSLGEYTEELNNSRASLERSIYKLANKEIKERFDVEADPAIVIAGEGWHKGVIGIVAGRLVERFHRPAVVIALDELGVSCGTGSARSVPGVNLHDALCECSEFLLSHGGHAAAAGLRIDPKKIDAFRSCFFEQIEERFTEGQRVPEIRIDTEAPISAMTLRSVQQIESLAPFGQDNPRPLFCTSGVALGGDVRAMGKGERHVTLSLKQHGITLRAVAFNRPEWVAQLTMLDQPIEIAYRPVINEFRGRRSVELQLADWRLPESEVISQAS